MTAGSGRRVITISAVCTATVEEAWTWEVPDGFDLSGTPEEIHDRLMGETESPPGVVFRGVENVEVNDETDRIFRGVGVER